MTELSEEQEACFAVASIKREELDVQTLATNIEALFFFSPAAFKYYLPAYLKNIILDYHSARSFAVIVVGRLTPDSLFNCFEHWYDFINPLSWAASYVHVTRCRRDFMQLTLEESVCVHKVLTFLAEILGNEEAKVAAQFWEQRFQSLSAS